MALAVQSPLVPNKSALVTLVAARFLLSPFQTLRYMSSSDPLKKKWGESQMWSMMMISMGQVKQIRVEKENQGVGLCLRPGVFN